MRITLDKAADAIVNTNVLTRLVVAPTQKRYCAKCKTELSLYYAENANYIVFCKKCETKTIVKAHSWVEAANKVGVQREPEAEK